MKKIFYLNITVIVVLIDQFSKHLAISKLAAYQPIFFNPILNLTLAFNSGTAFSMFYSLGQRFPWVFILINLIIISTLIIWLIKLPAESTLTSTALAVILGGALANLWDRMNYGVVIDFLDFHYKHYHWPIFNFADAAICVGIGLLMLDVYLNPNNSKS